MYIQKMLNRLSKLYVYTYVYKCNIYNQRRRGYGFKEGQGEHWLEREDAGGLEEKKEGRNEMRLLYFN